MNIPPWACCFFKSLFAGVSLTPLSGPGQVCPLINGILSGLDVTLVHNIAGKSSAPLKECLFPQGVLSLHITGQLGLTGLILLSLDVSLFPQIIQMSLR